jgi:TRAP transporter TAXI family solute receptor
MMRAFLLLLCISCSVLLPVSPTIAQGTAHPEVNISALSTPFGTGSYVLSAALEEIAKKYHPWLRIHHSESPGQIYNVKRLASDAEARKSMIVTSSPGNNWAARNGIKPYSQKLKTPKLIATYNQLFMWLATLDPNIKQGKDLAGKRIALGRITQISWAIQPEWVIREGWGIAKQVKVEYVGTSEATTALLDGLADAAIVGGYIDPISNAVSLSPQTIELMASGRAICNIPFDTPSVEKAAAKMENSITPVTLPAKAFQGLNEPLGGFVDNVAWTASEEFPEDVAYELTKLIINNCQHFAEFSDLGKLMSPKGLVFGWKVEDIHPGALKAYREAGIITK